MHQRALIDKGAWMVKIYEKHPHLIGRILLWNKWNINVSEDGEQLEKRWQFLKVRGNGASAIMDIPDEATLQQK